MELRGAQIYFLQHAKELFPRQNHEFSSLEIKLLIRGSDSTSHTFVGDGILFS